MSLIHATHPSKRLWLLGTGLAAILVLVWTPLAALVADTDEIEAHQAAQGSRFERS